MLEITVLMDNTALIDRFFLAEPGFSLFLETDGARILFDCGYSAAYLYNAEQMKIDLRKLDRIALSHGHLDHTGGLPAYLRMMDEAVQEEIPHHIPTLVAHPWCFCPRTKESGQNIGSPIGVERIASRIPVELSEKAVYLTDDLIFLGDIPRVHSFEDPAPSRRQIWLSDGTVREDLLTDDTALVYLGSEGMVILTGCAHSGICNIITRAQEMTGEDRVRDIVGGLHLIRPSAERMEGTRAFLTTQEIQSLHPCHCTSFAARCSLAQDLPVEETGVGLRLIY